MQFQRAPFLIKFQSSIEIFRYLLKDACLQASFLKIEIEDEGLFYEAEIFVGKGIASLASYKEDFELLTSGRGMRCPEDSSRWRGLFLRR